mmetsp:Transcript_32475/g.36450  ORF Transcript_32475/g.36450 Transcript_32475/m.36450 type:complete len:127 (-) Transcript_32475:500-880(-)
MYRSRRTRTPPEQNERRCLQRHVYTSVMHASTEERHRLVPLPVNLSVRATDDTAVPERNSISTRIWTKEEEETRTEIGRRSRDIVVVVVVVVLFCCPQRRRRRQQLLRRLFSYYIDDDDDDVDVGW